MEWRPVVAGVDATPEGAWAAAVAWRFAEAAGVSCVPVHAVREITALAGATPGVLDPAALREAVLARARETTRKALEGNAPKGCVAALELRIGRPVSVLAQAVADHGAGLVVVGGKRHRALGRWLAGSTAHDAVRVLDVPVLVATLSAAKIQRVLTAVDLSEAAGPTIAEGARVARLFGASLRVMHVIEPVPFAAELPTLIDPVAYEASATAILDEVAWPLAADAGAERVVRRGAPRAAIAEEAAAWDASIVVLGSRGKGWVDRMLLGSVTEAALRDLPASILVVPIRKLGAR